LYCSESVVLQSLSRRMYQAFIAVDSLYNVLSPKLLNNSVRELIQNSFVTSVICVMLLVCSYVLFLNLCYITVCITVCLAAIWRNNKYVLHMSRRE